MNDRLGFVSDAGIAASLIVLALVLGWTFVAGPTLFSPGPLNAVAKAQPVGGVMTHAELAGKCGACHPAPWSKQTMADRCAGCHSDVAGEIASKIGIHGRLLGALSSVTCKGCHSEHHGAQGALTVANGTSFPHDLTGYSLRGHVRTSQGRPFTCADCHAAGLASFDQTSCASCHATIDSAFMAQHELVFGTSCLICHNGRVNNGKDFDHNKLPFKLTGKHAGVACGKCHSSGGSFAASGQAPRDCGVCHAKNDKHNGTFGTQCGSCHNVNGWTGARFDHAIFPVNHGNHGLSSKCETCHPSGTSTYTCYGCHTHTTASVLGQHQNKSLADLADCVHCHKGGSSGGD